MDVQVPRVDTLVYRKNLKCEDLHDSVIEERNKSGYINPPRPEISVDYMETKCTPMMSQEDGYIDVIDGYQPLPHPQEGFGDKIDCTKIIPTERFTEGIVCMEKEDQPEILTE